MTTMQGKKFVAPGAWFSMVYPESWNEFEDTENTFLFYNPNKWTGNFRISAYKPGKGTDSISFGRRFVEEELQENSSAALVKVGNLACAYSKEMFQEEDAYYVSHLWVAGVGDVGFECSFTVPKGGTVEEAEAVIASLEVREEGRKYPAELIPVRVLEICEINEYYDWAVSAVKEQLTKDFQGIEEDLEKLQQVIDSGAFTPKQKDAWIAFGIAVCIILANEVEGMEWTTLIDGNREAPVLRYKDTDTVIDPMNLVWSKIKRGNPCDVVATYRQILENL